MNTCPNCKYSTNEAVQFCPVCGTQMSNVSQPQPPIYGDPMYGAPVKQPSIGKIVAGMVLSIIGFTFALMSLFGLAAVAADAVTGAALLVAYGILGLPFSVIGLILSAGAVRKGSQARMAKAGKLLGLIGVIISGIAIVVGFICIAAAGANAYSSALYY